MKKIKRLAVLLLEYEYGIDELSYLALLHCMDEKTAQELNKRVKAHEGSFYLPNDHDLQNWK